MSQRTKARGALIAQRLTPEAFAGFGTVIQADGESISANADTARRYDIERQPARAARTGYDLVTSLFDTCAQEMPLNIELLEKHRYSRQIIMPVDGAGYLTIVCESNADGTPALATLRAFFCTGRQGVIYNANVWHHPIASLRRSALYLVQSWQDGSASDCEECLIYPVKVVLEEGIDERI